jgi:hypothetical protein
MEITKKSTEQAMRIRARGAGPAVSLQQAVRLWDYNSIGIMAPQAFLYLVE